jgi:hypothetical protein
MSPRRLFVPHNPSTGRGWLDHRWPRLLSSLFQTFSPFFLYFLFISFLLLLDTPVNPMSTTVHVVPLMEKYLDALASYTKLETTKINKIKKYHSNLNLFQKECC